MRSSILKHFAAHRRMIVEQPLQMLELQGGFSPGRKSEIWPPGDLDILDNLTYRVIIFTNSSSLTLFALRFSNPA